MYLLYLDDSGSVGNQADKHIVLAGVAVFERQPYWFSGEVDKIAARLNPADPASLEFHGSPMRTGRGVWRRFAKDERMAAYCDALGLLARSRHVHLFGVSVHKRAVKPQRSPERIHFCS